MGDKTQEEILDASNAAKLCEIYTNRSNLYLFQKPQARYTLLSPYFSDSSTNAPFNKQQFDLDMRRKAEILKYDKQSSQTNNLTNSQKWSKMASAKRVMRRTPDSTSCVNMLVPTSSSGVPGPIVYLYEDPSMNLYNYKKNYAAYPASQLLPVDIYLLQLVNDAYSAQQDASMQLNIIYRDISGVYTQILNFNNDSMKVYIDNSNRYDASANVDASNITYIYDKTNGYVYDIEVNNKPGVRIMYLSNIFPLTSNDFIYLAITSAKYDISNNKTSINDGSGNNILIANNAYKTAIDCSNASLISTKYIKDTSANIHSNIDGSYSYYPTNTSTIKNILTNATIYAKYSIFDASTAMLDASYTIDMSNLYFYYSIDASKNLQKAIDASNRIIYQDISKNYYAPDISNSISAQKYAAQSQVDSAYVKYYPNNRDKYAALTHQYSASGQLYAAKSIVSTSDAISKYNALKTADKNKNLQSSVNSTDASFVLLSKYDISYAYYAANTFSDAANILTNVINISNNISQSQTDSNNVILNTDIGISAVNDSITYSNNALTDCSLVSIKISYQKNDVRDISENVANIFLDSSYSRMNAIKIYIDCSNNLTSAIDASNAAFKAVQDISNAIGSFGTGIVNANISFIYDTSYVPAHYNYVAQDISSVSTALASSVACFNDASYSLNSVIDASNSLYSSINAYQISKSDISNIIIDASNAYDKSNDVYQSANNIISSAVSFIESNAQTANQPINKNPLYYDQINFPATYDASYAFIVKTIDSIYNINLKITTEYSVNTVGNDIFNAKQTADENIFAATNITNVNSINNYLNNNAKKYNDKTIAYCVDISKCIVEAVIYDISSVKYVADASQCVYDISKASISDPSKLGVYNAAKILFVYDISNAIYIHQYLLDLSGTLYPKANDTLNQANLLLTDASNASSNATNANNTLINTKTKMNDSANQISLTITTANAQYLTAQDSLLRATDMSTNSFIINDYVQHTLVPNASISVQNIINDMSNVIIDASNAYYYSNKIVVDSSKVMIDATKAYLDASSVYTYLNTNAPTVNNSINNSISDILSILNNCIPYDVSSVSSATILYNDEANVYQNSQFAKLDASNNYSIHNYDLSANSAQYRIDCSGNSIPQSYLDASTSANIAYTSCVLLANSLSTSISESILYQIDASKSMIDANNITYFISNTIDPSLNTYNDSIYQCKTDISNALTGLYDASINLQSVRNTFSSMNYTDIISAILNLYNNAIMNKNIDCSNLLFDVSNSKTKCDILITDASLSKVACTNLNKDPSSNMTFVDVSKNQTAKNNIISTNNAITDAAGSLYVVSSTRITPIYTDIININQNINDVSNAQFYLTANIPAAVLKLNSINVSNINNNLNIVFGDASNSNNLAGSIFSKYTLLDASCRNLYQDVSAMYQKSIDCSNSVANSYNYAIQAARDCSDCYQKFIDASASIPTTNIILAYAKAFDCSQNLYNTNVIASDPSYSLQALSDASIATTSCTTLITVDAASTDCDQLVIDTNNARTNLDPINIAKTNASNCTNSFAASTIAMNNGYTNTNTEYTDVSKCSYYLNASYKLTSSDIYIPYLTIGSDSSNALSYMIDASNAYSVFIDNSNAYGFLNVDASGFDVSINYANSYGPNMVIIDTSGYAKSYTQAIQDVSSANLHINDFSNNIIDCSASKIKQFITNTYNDYSNYIIDISNANGYLQDISAQYFLAQKDLKQIGLDVNVYLSKSSADVVKSAEQIKLATQANGAIQASQNVGTLSTAAEIKIIGIQSDNLFNQEKITDASINYINTSIIATANNIKTNTIIVSNINDISQNYVKNSQKLLYISESISYSTVTKNTISYKIIYTYPILSSDNISVYYSATNIETTQVKPFKKDDPFFIVNSLIVSGITYYCILIQQTQNIV